MNGAKFREVVEGAIKRLRWDSKGRSPMRHGYREGIVPPGKFIPDVRKGRAGVRTWCKSRLRSPPLPSALNLDAWRTSCELAGKSGHTHVQVRVDELLRLLDYVEGVP